MGTQHSLIYVCQHCGVYYNPALSTAPIPTVFCTAECQEKQSKSMRKTWISAEIPLGEPELCNLGSISLMIATEAVSKYLGDSPQ